MPSSNTLKYLAIIATYCVLVSSCNNTTCDITDYKNGNWIKVNSSVSYKVCGEAEQALTPGDSIHIEFLGNLKRDQNILVQGPEGMALLTIFAGIPFGRFERKQLDTFHSLKNILPVITKNRECVVRLNLSQLKIPEFSKAMTVYFKTRTDTSDILDLNNKILKLGFVDSIRYVSNEAAAKKYSEDNDSTWRNFLENNPLPSSTDIYIKREAYSRSLRDSLKNLLFNEKIISEISYPADDSAIPKLLETLQYPFFIKIKS